MVGVVVGVGVGVAVGVGGGVAVGVVVGVAVGVGVGGVMSRYATDSGESAKTPWASDQGHWYHAVTGEPCYTVIGKNGKERNTTLADARKLNLVPSVTGILRCADKPQLTKWIVQQAIEAALTLPRIEGESSDAFIERVEKDWQEEGKAAADRGTEIHAAIERHFRGQETPEWQEWVLAATAELERACGPQKWLPEHSFACPAGYGGKVDLHSTEYVVDFKTKDGTPTGDLYDDHFCQIAAYRHGLCPVSDPYHHAPLKGGILFVSRTAPMASFVEIEELELVRGWNCFKALLEYWRHKSRYFP